MRQGDVYSMVHENRRRLFSLFALFTLLVMVLSGTGVYLLHRIFLPDVDTWIVLTLFWLLYALFVLVRYALGGGWVLRKVETLPSSKTDRRLENALQAARLACGTECRIRLLEVPSRDINSFSVALPDGSSAVFVTSGVAEKLPAREREAVMAHELAHIASGDTTLQSVFLRLVGPGGPVLKAGHRPAGMSLKVPPLLLLLPLLTVVLTSASRTEGKPPPAGLYAASLLLLFAVLSSSLPFLIHCLMRLLLDREREYYADLQAAYVLRDPEAVHGAVRHAAEDVLDLLLLPRNLDAVLFHPVVDYTSYRPFQTQPTMAERLRRLEFCFPGLSGTGRPEDAVTSTLRHRHPN